MNVTAHTVLRDRRSWRGHLRGLSIAPNGDLSLARVPSPPSGKALDVPTSYPYAREASGIALGPCESVFVADTAHDRILFVDGLCGEQVWLPSSGDPSIDAPGHFASPRGLAVGPDYLLVADAGHGALQQLAFPRLEPNYASKALRAPVCVAFDARARLLVVDAHVPAVHRILQGGEIDALFAANLARRSKLRSPFCVVVGAAECVLVSDSVANEVFVFDSEGIYARSLPGPDAWLPGALAAQGALTYVADAASGAILVFDDAELQGHVDGWRGPVTALAVGTEGDLYVKPGLDSSYFRLAAGSAFVTNGELWAGPFDAGEDRVWERAWIDAEVSSEGRIDVEVALRSDTHSPHPTEWRRLPSADALLGLESSDSGRFVWLRLHLSTTSARASPVLRQVRCATPSEDYLDYLPMTYRRHDNGARFLSRWLKLIRSEFGRIEETIDSLPRLADPEFVPAGSLRWLAQWFGLELPQIADDDEGRALIGRAVNLLARRGTAASIAEFVELHTGIRPVIVEAFTGRRVWVLGVSSRLDFDTRLALVDPGGIMVPDAAPDDGCPGAIGNAVVGASGPLATYQIGVPLFAGEAYRFCVVIDAYRLRDASQLAELRRIVDREKPAHTDYRVEVVAPEMRIGFQARIGIDAIVGGEPPSGGLDAARLGVDSLLPRTDVARVADARLDGTLILN